MVTSRIGSGAIEAGPGQRGFHKPLKLSRLDRRGAVVGRASFKRIKPVARLRNSRDHNEGHPGPRRLDAPQQRQVTDRFAAREHDIRIQELLYIDVLRLFLDVMVIYSKRVANLPCGRLFQANQNYLCHNESRVESASPPGRHGEVWPRQPKMLINVAPL